MQRWLGVWFDHKMNVKHQLKNKAASAPRAFNAIARLACTENCLRYEALWQLFQTSIAAISDCGAEVWWNRQEGLSNTIQHTQNQAMCKIAAPFRTAPTAAPDADTALPLTPIRVNALQETYPLQLVAMPATHLVLLFCPESLPKHPRTRTTTTQEVTPGTVNSHS